MTRLALAAALAVLPSAALGAGLPAHLDTAAPFPDIAIQAPAIERISPGIEYGDYELWTSVGPISVHVIAADINDPSVRVATVLAHDELTSEGETVTSMAQRTDAVAGINGDYFDIGSTNQPTNIVVRDGTLVRTPRRRYALAVLRTGGAHFAEFSFAGTVQIGTQNLALEAVNELPDHDDALALLTPAFGEVPATPGVTLVSLTPTNGSPPFATYRVSEFAQSTDGTQPPGYYLAVGSAVAPDALPNPGDALSATGDLTPIPLAQIASAIGGGPLILYNGTWFDDPDGPSGGEFDRRIPCSGVALEADGTLLLVEVDGRQAQRSVGLTRPEFAALMIALGARDGIALDGGGSSTIAARLLGEEAPALQSSPSDGDERHVADGIFLYNDAAIGPPEGLAASPETLRALVGAEATLHVDAIDANEHPVDIDAPITATVKPATLGTIVGDRFVAAAAGDGEIRFRSGTLEGSVPLEVASAPTRIAILPENANVDPHDAIDLHARAFDAAGFELALPPALPWKTTSGSIDEKGRFVAAGGDADVSLDLGGRVASLRITVGSHVVAGASSLEGVRFLSIPAGGSGSAQSDPSCADCIRLAYALGPTERAAYAVVEQPLPDGTVGIEFDLQDDGSGAELRIALRNAINEQTLVTATILDQPGRRHVIVRFPAGIAQPMRLVGFYTLATRSAPAPSGAIVIGNVHPLVAGTP